MKSRYMYITGLERKREKGRDSWFIFSRTIVIIWREKMRQEYRKFSLIVNIWSTEYSLSFKRSHAIAYSSLPPLNQTSFGFIVVLSDKHCAIYLSSPLSVSLCPFPHCQKLRRGLPGSPQHLRLSRPSRPSPLFQGYRFSLISTAKKILIADIPTWEIATDDNRCFYYGF